MGFDEKPGFFPTLQNLERPLGLLDPDPNLSSCLSVLCDCGVSVVRVGLGHVHEACPVLLSKLKDRDKNGGIRKWIIHAHIWASMQTIPKILVSLQ